MRLALMVDVLPSFVVSDWPAQLLSVSPVSVVPLVSQPLSAPGAAGSEQSLYGAAHVGVQTPLLHAVPVVPAVEQPRPQAPQLAGSPLPVLVVQPPLLSAPHAPHGAVHVGLQKKPLPCVVHVVVPCGFEQTLPQPPQLFGPLKSTSQPSSGRWLQSAWVASHVGWQTYVVPDSTQALVPPTCWQTWPQPPQFAGVFSGVSQPSAMLLLQSA
jgi:hypothetical protein